MILLSTDEHTGSTRFQETKPVNFLLLVLGNEIEYDGFAPDWFDSYELAVPSPEVEVKTSR
jgi:hypothetical protein